jgi:hypothetical protein
MAIARVEQRRAVHRLLLLVAASLNALRRGAPGISVTPLLGEGKSLISGFRKDAETCVLRGATRQSRAGVTR